jgi:hypothetical protein
MHQPHVAPWLCISYFFIRFLSVVGLQFDKV